MTRENFLKEAKILEYLNYPNIVSFKNVGYQPLPLRLKMYHLVFFRLEQFLKLVDWMGF